ncbi:hypothetical protein V5O48_012036 [Marasmius crinis-equi]|uniref:Uncharacterized protein n=1 Tax=Marasmius crinis-equi TaxID=585013 RepID=A0ABR3F3Y8_9AGAR
MSRSVVHRSPAEVYLRDILKQGSQRLSNADLLFKTMCRDSVDLDRKVTALVANRPDYHAKTQLVDLARAACKTVFLLYFVCSPGDVFLNIQVRHTLEGENMAKVLDDILSFVNEVSTRLGDQPRGTPCVCSMPGQFETCEQIIRTLHSMIGGVVQSFKLGSATLDQVVNNVLYLSGFTFLLSKNNTVERFAEASRFFPDLDQIRRSGTEDVKNLWTICLYAQDVYRAAQRNLHWRDGVATIRSVVVWALQYYYDQSPQNAAKLNRALENLQYEVNRLSQGGRSPRLDRSEVILQWLQTLVPVDF